MRRILSRRPKFWRSENMAKFPENRHISYVINMSCKVIARKDKRFWSENDKIGNHYGSKTGNFLHLKLNSSKSLRN